MILYLQYFLLRILAVKQTYWNQGNPIITARENIVFNRDRRRCEEIGCLN